jgi:DNA-binding MarR family transcriptional regulator
MAVHEVISMTNTTKADQPELRTIRTNEKKWTKPLMDAGWNVVPNIIIEKQEALGLNAIDMNIVLHLTQYWWKADDLPHPSVGTIARAIGVKPRTIQKHIKSLEDIGFLRRQARRTARAGSDTNLYDLSGLIEKATPYAQEKLQAIAKSKEDRKERISRKKPKLIVNNE